VVKFTCSEMQRPSMLQVSEFWQMHTLYILEMICFDQFTKVPCCLFSAKKTTTILLSKIWF
jgi:hypothetical protein